MERLGSNPKAQVMHASSLFINEDLSAFSYQRPRRPAVRRRGTASLWLRLFVSSVLTLSPAPLESIDHGVDRGRCSGKRHLSLLRLLSRSWSFPSERRYGLKDYYGQPSLPRPLFHTRPRQHCLRLAQVDGTEQACGLNRARDGLLVIIKDRHFFIFLRLLSRP